MVNKQRGGGEKQTRLTVAFLLNEISSCWLRLLFNFFLRLFKIIDKSPWAISLKLTIEKV